MLLTDMMHSRSTRKKMTFQQGQFDEQHASRITQACFVMQLSIAYCHFFSSLHKKMKSPLNDRDFGYCQHHREAGAVFLTMSPVHSAPIQNKLY